LSFIYRGKKTRVEILAEIDMIEYTAVKEKKSQVFEELMTYQKKVFLICLGFSRNASDAQDLAQDVYLKAYKNIGTLSELSLAKFWLFRIARNTCLNFQKKHRLDRISASKITQKMKDPQTPESEMIHQEQLRQLKEAIQKLPKKQRDVFVLKEYGDLSYQEIAETLKIELGTVMSRLNRARQAIKEQIKGDKNV
jgi:RNA polymerase sigma-70 factor (ECF subfamily)